MKKLAIIAAVLLVIPVMAQARMDSMSDDSLGVIHGRVGITIDFTTRLIDSYFAITDSNGDAGGTYTGQGALTLSGLKIGGTGGLSTPMTVEDLKLDVGTTGGATALVIGLPEIQGIVQVDEVLVGGSADSGSSLGALTWGDIHYDTTTCTVTAH